MHPLKKIMVVDDEDDIRDVVGMALEMASGLAVEGCGSGREAVARARAVRPDMILLDVMMPGMDGPTTLAALRQDPELVGIPVVFLTAKAQAGELDRFLELGAADVIAKPFDPMTLGEKLQSIWKALHER